MRVLLLVLALMPTAAAADPKAAEAEIRAVIGQWYGELAKEDDGRTHGLTAPAFIEASPHYHFRDTGSAALTWPPIYDSLPATALRFSWDIDVLRIDPNFAKAIVWEKGYFYAWVAQRTYERAASTTFVLERVDGRWLILAHQSDTVGIPPNKITDPMPDLRDLFYATQGKDRDPEADAAKARTGEW